MSGSRGGFSVTISAVDAASKQIDAVNARIRAMQAPAERVTKSLGRLSDTTGITALGNGMRSLARESLQVFENIGRIGGPLGAITGVASIAGLAKMTMEFAAMGSQLGFASARTGVAVGQLSSLQGAAKLAGSSAESLTSGMKTLKDNIFEISAGRAAPTTIAAFNQLGITLRDKVTGQLRGAADVLPELADKIAAIKDPTMQATFATMTLGGAGEDLLPFLRRGAAGIAEYNAKAVSYGSLSKAGADAANELRERQAELGLATEGLSLSIGEKLAPVLGPMLTDLAGFIRDNREMVSNDIAKWAGDYGAAIKGVAGAIKSASGNWIDWNKALEVGIPLLMAQAIPGVTKLEGVLAKLALIQVPAWLGALLGIGTAGVWTGAAVGAATYGGYKGAVKSGTSIAQAAEVGLTPLMLDDRGMAMGYKDAAGRTYSNEDADRIANRRTFSGEHWEPPAAEQEKFVPLGTKIWEGAKSLFGGGKAAPAKNQADPKQLHDYFRSQGWSEPQVAGILASYQGESAMNAANVGDKDKSGVYQAGGLAMLRDARRSQFAAMHNGRDVTTATPLEQAEFTQWELTHTEKAAGDHLRAATTARQAGEIVSKEYERPQDVSGNAALRGKYAEIWQQKFSGDPANIQGGSGTAGPVAATTTTVKGSADLRVKIEGPAGMPTRTSATTSGDLFNGAPKIETAMAGVGP